MEWIKVTPETLPEFYQSCLVTIELKYNHETEVEKVVDSAVYRPGEGYLCSDWDTFNDWDEGQEYIKVTHWMPYPEPADIVMVEKLKFVLNGCDISFIAEAPHNITLEQLLKQTDKIKPDWCACGICSLEAAGLNSEYNPVEIFIDYNGIRKAGNDVSCTIVEG